MSSIPNSVPNIEQLEQWLAQGASGSDAIEKLQQMVMQVQGQILDLQAKQTDLNAQLSDLEKIADPTKAQKDEMDSLKGQISGNQSKLNQFNSELSVDKNFLKNSESNYNNFVSESKTMSNSSLELNKQLKHSFNNFNNSLARINASQQEQSQAQQDVQMASKAITDYANLQAQFTTDAMDQLTRMQTDQQRIDTDKAQASAAQAQLIEDCILGGVFLLLAIGTGGLFGPAAAYYAAMATKDGMAMQQYKDDEAAASSDLTQAKAALLQDLNGLTQSNVGELKTMIDELFVAVDKILKTLGTGQGSVEDATKALAAVLSFLQMITTKIHQLKAQDQVWIDKSNAVGFQVAANKTQANYLVMAILLAVQDFLKVVKVAAQVVADVASVAFSVLSGGVLAPIMAALMVTLSATGAFDKITDALTHAISQSDAVWARVVAEVIVTVVCVIVTCSLTAAVEEVTTAAAREASTIMQRVVIFLKTLLKTLLSPKTLQVFKTLQGLGMSVMYFGMNNGFADLVEWAVAACEQKGDESKKELENDKTFQILQMVMGILQAILVAVAGYKTMSAGRGQQSLIEMIFGKVSQLEGLLYGAQGLQILSGGLNAVGLSYQATNSATQASLTIESGKAEANILAYKAMHDMAKMLEGKELEAFAALIQQEVQSLLITMRKMGESELEAARMLLETAV